MSARTSLPSTTQPGRRRVGLLSTYPPQLCGLATFAAALGAELRDAGNDVEIVRIADGQDSTGLGSLVVAELVNGDPASLRSAAAELSRGDVAIIQHEYGIYGGSDGDEILTLLALLEVPTIVVLHTVLLHPTPGQLSVLTSVCALADRVVVMTGTAKTRLISCYPVDHTKVVTIPHGAAVPRFGANEATTCAETPLRLLTWGLIGPGKGIEHAIDAVSLAADLVPAPQYTVAGVTHPKVLERDGDRYRRSLIERARSLDVHACFDDTYRNVDELTRFVSEFDVVVLPYDSRDQVTSGVLVDAIAAGRPVIATAFPHAIELLGSGAGVVVPHEDPLALAEAIRSVAIDRNLLASMAAEARRLAPSLSWAAVASRYSRLADQVVHSGEPVRS